MRFIKKPVAIDAIQWTGDNFEEVQRFMNEGLIESSYPELWQDKDKLYIITLEGRMRADCNDWIIRGVVGEFYPCKPEIFDKTYTPAEEQSDEANIRKCSRCGSINTTGRISKAKIISDDTLKVYFIMQCLECGWVYYAGIQFNPFDMKRIEARLEGEGVQEEKE